MSIYSWHRLKRVTTYWGIDCSMPLNIVYMLVSGGLCCIVPIFFALHHNVTHCAMVLFAAIVMAWLCCNNTAGPHNLFNYNPKIRQTKSPYYMYNYLKVFGKDGWIPLGGALLRTTCMHHEFPFVFLFSLANSCYHDFISTPETTNV